MTQTRAPLSLQQQFLAMFAPDPGAESTEGPFGPWYHGVKGWLVSGDLNLEALQTAANIAVAVHPALRTSLVFDEEPHQRVASVDSCHVPVVAMGSIEADASSVDRFLNELEGAPLPADLLPHMRIFVAKRGPQENLVAVMVHHIAMDGLSMDLLMRTVFDAYHDLVKWGEADPSTWEVPGYPEYAEWQRERFAELSPETSVTYWAGALEGKCMTGIAGDRQSGAQREGTAVLRFEIPAESVQGARRLARDHRCTLFTVLLTAFELMVAETTSQRQLLVPTIMHGRPHSTAVAGGQSFDQTVGPFFNFVPMVSSFDDAKRLVDVLMVTRASVAEALENEIPFPILAQANPGIMATFADPAVGVCAFQSFEFADDGVIDQEHIRIEEVRARMLSQDRGSHIPNGALFTLETQGEGPAYGNVRYDPGQFDSTTIAGWVSRFEQFLKDLSTSPDAPLSGVAAPHR